jgi:hypothetical protein
MDTKIDDDDARGFCGECGGRSVLDPCALCWELGIRTSMPVRPRARALDANADDLDLLEQVFVHAETYLEEHGAPGSWEQVRALRLRLFPDEPR